MINRKSVRQGITGRLILAGLCLLAINLTAWSTARAQSDKKTLVRRLTVMKYPLELAIELNGEEVKTTKAVLPEQGIRTEQFEGDADWLKNLTLKVKNISDKVISYMVLDLTFPQTATSEHPQVGLHQIFLGVDPDRKFPRPELRLAPHESIEIPLATLYKDFKTLVEFRLPIEQVTQIEIEFHAAMFDDGTLFETGEMYRRNPDPNDPHKWIKINQ